MVYLKKERKKRENLLSSINKFASFMNNKGIILEDREYLMYKNFLQKKKQIMKTSNIIEIMLGYVFTNYKPKTLFVCDHITTCLVRHKTNKILSHICGLTTSLDVVSDFELMSKMNNYKNVQWDRIVVFTNEESKLNAGEIIYVK